MKAYFFGNWNTFEGEMLIATHYTILYPLFDGSLFYCVGVFKAFSGHTNFWENMLFLF